MDLGPVTANQTQPEIGNSRCLGHPLIMPISGTLSLASDPRNGTPSSHLNMHSVLFEEEDLIMSHVNLV